MLSWRIFQFIQKEYLWPLINDINLLFGGKGYLPWLSDGSRLSEQGVSVLDPSLPSVRPIVFNDKSFLCDHFLTANRLFGVYYANSLRGNMALWKNSWLRLFLRCYWSPSAAARPIIRSLQNGLRSVLRIRRRRKKSLKLNPMQTGARALGGTRCPGSKRFASTAWCLIILYL